LYTRLRSTGVPPEFAAVNQPLKINPGRVGIGKAVKISLFPDPVTAEVGAPAGSVPPCGLNVTTLLVVQCAKIVIFSPKTVFSFTGVAAAPLAAVNQP
jgi:hypothetical protein